MTAFCLILACTFAGDSARPAAITTDYAMDGDPAFPDVAVLKAYSEKYLPLWLQALDRPEADLQRLAAETVAQAQIEGMPDMIKAKPALVRIVSASQTHPSARFTAARALVALDAKDASPQLFQASQLGGAEQVRQIVEPALARWKHAPALDVWRKRLVTPETHHRDLVLALRCLGIAGDQGSVPQLLIILHERRRLEAERLCAARSAALLKTSGLEGDAEKLATPDGKIVDRLCAAALLEKHDSEAAKKLLLALAADVEPSVASAALRRLNSLDFALVVPLAEKAMQSPDSGVRREGVRAYTALPTAERITFAGKLLDDPHPGVRALVREELRFLAGDSQWKDVVLHSATDALAATSWRGQEQAALLLGALDHKPAAPRLIQLLDSTRFEVGIASAWALRKLAVPETVADIFKKASYLTEVRLRQRRSFDPLDFQNAHLLEALGMMKYQPAEELMRQHVAKNFTYGEYSRSAAIWSLGLLHRGQPDERLAASIAGRVTESPAAMPPEMTRIRYAGAIALGTMKAKSQASALREFVAHGADKKLHFAIRWSLHEMTGEEIPPPEPTTISKGSWFLSPLDIGEVNLELPNPP